MNRMQLWLLLKELCLFSLKANMYTDCLIHTPKTSFEAMRVNDIQLALELDNRFKVFNRIGKEGPVIKDLKKNQRPLTCSHFRELGTNKKSEIREISEPETGTRKTFVDKTVQGKCHCLVRHPMLKHMSPKQHQRARL